jgi:hypothetical protein
MVMLLTIDLRADAAAEAARLDAARALIRHSERQPAGAPGNPDDSGSDEIALAQLDGEAAWIITARSPALRRRLGGRALLIWRVACEDASGRLLESRLVAIAVALSTGTRPRRRARVETLVRALERETARLAERSCDEWRIVVEQTTRSFATTRAARARAIALIGRDAASSLVQPGLFDRRAERPADSSVARSRAIAPHTAARIRPELKLVVVP